MNIYDYDISNIETIKKDTFHLDFSQYRYYRLNLKSDTCLFSNIVKMSCNLNGHNLTGANCILGKEDYTYFNERNEMVSPNYRYYICVSSDTRYLVKSMYDSKRYISCIKSKFLRTFCANDDGRIKIYNNKNERLYYLVVSVFTGAFQLVEYPNVNINAKSVKMSNVSLKCKLNEDILKIDSTETIIFSTIFDQNTINQYDAIFQEYHLNTKPLCKIPEGFIEKHVFSIDNNILRTSFTDNFVWTYDIELNENDDRTLRHLYKLLEDWNKITLHKYHEVFLDKTKSNVATFFYGIIQQHCINSCYSTLNIYRHDCSISTRLCSSPKQRIFTFCIPLNDHCPIQKVVLNDYDDDNNINVIVVPLNTNSISVFNYNMSLDLCDKISDCIFLHVYEYISKPEYFAYWEDYHQYPRRLKPFLSSLVSDSDMLYNPHLRLKQYKRDRTYEIKQSNITRNTLPSLYELINKGEVIHFIKTLYKHTETYSTDYEIPILPNFYLKPEICTKMAMYVERGGVVNSFDISGIVTSIIDLLNVNYNSNYKIHKSFFNLYNNDIPYENKYCEKVMFDSNNNYTYITLHLNDTYEYKENIKKERVGTLSFVNCYQNEIINEISSGHKITFTIILKERICSKNTLLIESEVSELLDMIMTLGISKDFTKIEENKVIDINTYRMSPWQVQYVIWKNELLKSSHVELFDTITKIRRKITDKYIIDTIHIYDDKTIDDDFIYIIKPGHFLAKHTDNFNHEGGLYLRFNVLLLEPDIGGVPLYDSRCYFSDVGDVLICNAGDYYHETTAVQGTKSRVTVSIGIVIKKEFKYLYNDLY